MVAAAELLSRLKSRVMALTWATLVSCPGVKEDAVRPVMVIVALCPTARVPTWQLIG